MCINWYANQMTRKRIYRQQKVDYYKIYFLGILGMWTQ